MSMFGFLNDFDNYDTRKVACDEFPWGFISTARVSDGRQPFETAVQHSAYRDDGMIIVEAYDTKADAKRGHAKWLAAMTADVLPESLADCANAELCGLGEAFGVDMRAVYPLQKANA